MQTQPISSGQWIVGLLAFALVFTLLLSVSRRREVIWSYLRLAIIFGGVSWVVASVLEKMGKPEPKVLGAIAGLVVAGLTFKRSRYVRTSIRRTKISEWEKQHGKRFNSRTHEVDHIIPFSKWGGGTGDNLKVTTREKNRAKGAKSPWWDWFG